MFPRNFVQYYFGKSEPILEIFGILYMKRKVAQIVSSLFFIILLFHRKKDTG